VTIKNENWSVFNLAIINAPATPAASLATLQMEKAANRDIDGA